MYIICCHDKYTSRATRLTSAETIEEAKEKGLKLRKVYRHITVADVDSKKIVMQRKERGCCKVDDVVFTDGSAL